MIVTCLGHGLCLTLSPVSVREAVFLAEQQHTSPQLHGDGRWGPWGGCGGDETELASFPAPELFLSEELEPVSGIGHPHL